MTNISLPNDISDLRIKADKIFQEMDANCPLYARPKKRSFNISGHQTSITLEDEYWHLLSEICDMLGMSKTSFIKNIDERRDGNLSSAVRIAILRIICG